MIQALPDHTRCQGGDAVKTLVVQKRLSFPPESLDRQAGPFLQAVQQLVRETKAHHQDLQLELADIGFSPKPDFIEVKLYFREPAGRESEEAVK
jgi:hypothetical protein